MAIVTIEGLLEIALEDVYTWLAAERFYSGDEPVTSMAFSIDDVALVLQLEGKDPVYVDAVDLWEWVTGHQLPRSLRAHETAFGVPTVDTGNHCLRITFASSNECDPRSWSKPPACLAEWTKKALETAAAGSGYGLWSPCPEVVKDGPAALGVEA